MGLQDEIWKDVIEKLFKDFILFFHKELHDKIDFNKKVKFLDKELQQLHRNYGKDHRYIDKLVQVFLQNGDLEYILIHIEIQGYTDNNFATRMFTYGYRIYDKHKIHPIGIVIFTDNNPLYKPSKYTFNKFGIKWEYSYLAFKLLEYKEEELLHDKNPFSLAILAYKMAQRTEKKDQERRNFKIKLLSLMYEYGYNKNQIRGMFRFIDGMLQLSNENEEKLVHQEIEKIEGVKHMTYVTSLERIAIKKGIQKGIQKGKKEGRAEGIQKGIIQSKKDDITKLYQYKYGNINEIAEYLSNITSSEKLQQLFDIVLYSKEKSEILQFLQKK